MLDRRNEKYKHKLYNIWRGFKFTKKGKLVGNCSKWDNYLDFYSDVIDDYIEGSRMFRKDKSAEFCKNNYYFQTDLECAQSRASTIKLEYNNENLTLREWAEKYNLSLNGITQRYHKGKNYTTEQIIFGKPYTRKITVRDFKELDYKKQRAKASKMISQYKLKDRKKNLKPDSNLTIEYMLENIFNKECTYCGTKHRLGADRKDNSKGHTIDNIVPACYECNTARGNNFSFEEMKILGETIKLIKRNRENGTI